MSFSWHFDPKQLSLNAFNIYEGPFRVQHLARGHLSWVGIWATGLLVGGWPLSPLSQSIPYNISWCLLTSVTSMTLMAASCPVLTCRPWRETEETDIRKSSASYFHPCGKHSLMVSFQTFQELSYRTTTGIMWQDGLTTTGKILIIQEHTLWKWHVFVYSTSTPSSKLLNLIVFQNVHLHGPLL